MRGPAAELVDELRPYVSDERVLAAIAAVPRECFVPDSIRDSAWRNSALPIGCGQTISQPLVVARMCELLALRGGEKVLDVGTGSGYHAAVLARLAAHVHSIEVHRQLSEGARASLERAGVGNVTLVVGDGGRGIPPEAPFDAINVAAATSEERLAPLLEQLAAGGRLVAPVGPAVAGADQHLVVLSRAADGSVRRDGHERVRFVPLVARQKDDL